ncbi:DUF1127 domain-containing protein [Falsiroseomonas oryzae]|uniref:DUF1127 domain-containing protein n=1 Tax=Falsiroseomonas oryzae TaxID=2766473 RepID=UPI0022EA4C35|nr:DUF1127 domain-containing protein [Roseomonas sp. MO-31]
MRIPAFIHLPGDAVAAHADAVRGNSLARWFGAILQLLQAWRDERRTLAEIARLDDATLRDIGVNRWELQAHMQAERERNFRQFGAWRIRP